MAKQATKQSSQPPEEQWRRVQADLLGDLGQDVFESWFGRVKLDGIIDTTVQLSVPTDFLKGWLGRHYREVLLAAWQRQQKSITHVEINMRGAATEKGRASQLVLAKKPAPPQKSRLELMRQVAQTQKMAAPPATPAAAPRPPKPTPSSVPTLPPRLINVTMEQIQQVVAEHYGIPVRILLQKYSPHKIHTALHISMWLSKRFIPELSEQDIVEGHNRKDRSMFVYARTNVERLLANSARGDVRAAVQALEERLILLYYKA